MINHIADHQFKAFVIDSNKKLVIVDFWAPWCQPCKVMDPILEEIAGTFPRDVDVIKINVDDEQRLAEVYKIKSIPSMLFFTTVKGKTEKEATQIVTGAVNKAELMQKIQQILT